MINKYDAIVVGTGISGGWAAKELCENGLKTLVLERGRMIVHPTDYKNIDKDPWEFMMYLDYLPSMFSRFRSTIGILFTILDNAKHTVSTSGNSGILSFGSIFK